MRLDDKGVAGFFEDIPVLMFVLAGVASLAFSGLVAAEAREEGRLQSELENAAQSLADNIIDRLCNPQGIGGSAPSCESVDGTDFSLLAAELSNGYACGIGLVRLYPTFEWLHTTPRADDLPHSTGFGARLLNAIDTSGLEVVLELRVVVWKA